MSFTINDLQIAWAAGFFDGEGSITSKNTPKNGKDYQYVMVSASQKDARPLMMFKLLFGGTITEDRRDDDRTFVWLLQDRIGILQFLHKVEPYLQTKREEAHIAIEILTSFPTNRKLSLAARSELARLFRTLSVLKKNKVIESRRIYEANKDNLPKGGLN